jgi:hypothetical protein
MHSVVLVASRHLFFEHHGLALSASGGRCTMMRGFRELRQCRGQLLAALLSGSTRQIKDCYFRPSRSGRLYFVSFFVTPHHLPPVQRPFLCAIPGLAHSSSGYLATNYLDTFSKRRALPNVCRASSLPSRGSLPTNAVFHGRPRKTSATSESEHQDRWPTRLNCNFAQGRLLRLSLYYHRAIPRRSSPSVSTAFLTAIASSAPQEPGKHQERRPSYLQSSTATLAHDT